MPKYKMIYSLKVRNLLAVMGFMYEQEVSNPQKEGFKCWLYEETPEFLEAFDRILTEGGHQRGNRK
jgi:hypothetical protein